MNRLTLPLIIFSVFSAIATIVVIAMGETDKIKLTASAFALSLAVLTMVNKKFKPAMLTFAIAASVVIGLSYPSAFISVGDFKYTSLFIPILQVIMFSMGTTLSLQDFTRVFKMPQGIFVGILCQFSIMPILGFLIVKVFNFPVEVAAGLILVGCSPSGLSSNIMAFIAKTNVAMSVSLTAVSTLLAPLLTPLLVKLLVGESVEIDAGAMMWTMMKMVLFPVILGTICHHLYFHSVKWRDKVMPVFSIAGMISLTLFTVALGRDRLIELGFFLILACFIHCVSGLTLGYQICRLLGMDKKTCRTISLEVGLQNAGMASGLTVALNKVATMGLAPIVFGPVMTLTTSALSNFWRLNPVDEQKTEVEPQNKD